MLSNNWSHAKYVFVYIIYVCVLCIFIIYVYVYIYTHTHTNTWMYIFKKNMLCLYIKYIYIKYKYINVYACKYFWNICCMWEYVYIHTYNKYTQCTHILCKQKRLFWLWLITINLFFFLHMTLTDGLELCGLLWGFYQLFGLSFWRHPFADVMPNISTSVLMNKQTMNNEEANSGKEWLCIFIQTNAKLPTSGRAIY